MIKRLLNISFYSIITFCIVSFSSFIFSLIFNSFKGTMPNLKVGFPFNFYYQFEIRDNCNGQDLLHGTNIKNFILNYIICLLLVLILNKFKLLNYIKSK